MPTVKLSPLAKIANIAAADDWEHDPWGTSLNLAFDICAVLDASDIEGDITPSVFARWQYRRGAHTVPSVETLAAEADNPDRDYSYGEATLAEALLAGHITQDDLIYAGEVLHRYSGLLKAAGRDY